MHPTTPADARQPYFAQARIAAASLSTTSPADQITLLRESLDIAPEAPAANSARLTLLLAQPATANPSASLALYRTLTAIPATPQTFTSPNTPEGDSSDLPEGDPTDATDAALDLSATSSPNATMEPDRNAATLPAAASALDLPTKIRLATLLANISQRNNDLLAALSFAQLAVDLAQASKQPALMHQRDNLKIAIALERRNALRRPNFHSELAQSTQIRPRLTAADLTRENQEDAP